jgi:uncharacterized protein (TIGR02145 family)
MLKNLDVTTYRNGDPIPLVTGSAAWAALTTGAYCYVNDDPSTVADYGLLYNYQAVSDPRGLAPLGWKPAGYSDWSDLALYIGTLGIDVSVAANALRETGTAHWASPNSNSTNSTGFTALGAGLRNKNGAYFSYFQSASVMWGDQVDIIPPNGEFVYSSDIRDSSVSDEWGGVGPGYPTGSGLSVRCVKNY